MEMREKILKALENVYDPEIHKSLVELGMIGDIIVKGDSLSKEEMTPKNKSGLMDNSQILCPACNSNKLMLKYEAKYVYSYVIDNDAPGLMNTTELLPYQYDKREQTEAKQYIECSDCGAQFPSLIDKKI